MKDKEARGQIQSVQREMRYNRELCRKEHLNALSIKDCPKCKHPVLAQGLDYFVGVEIKTDFRCLTCGSKFRCFEKCVCEIVEG